MRSWPHPKIDPLQRAAAAGSERACELRQQAGEEGQHLRVAGVAEQALAQRADRQQSRNGRLGETQRPAIARARSASERSRAEEDRYALPPSFSAANAGSEAASTAPMPALAASVYIAWPTVTPTAV